MGLRHDNLVVARVRPLDGKLPPDPVRGLLVLVDTSASRALGFHDQVARLSALVTSLRGPGGDLPLTVAAFDQTVEVMYSGAARGFGAAVEQKAAAAAGAGRVGSVEGAGLGGRSHPRRRVPPAAGHRRRRHGRPAGQRRPAGRR